MAALLHCLALPPLPRQHRGAQPKLGCSVERSLDLLYKLELLLGVVKVAEQDEALDQMRHHLI